MNTNLAWRLCQLAKAFALTERSQLGAEPHRRAGPKPSKRD